MKCTFCSKNIDKGTGIMFVRTTGKILNFCSRKCEKNMIKLKRKSRKFKWTGSKDKEKK